MRPADFDFDLPPGQIAQHPATVRGAARMLVLEGSAMTHSRASSLPTHLPADALVVVNDSRVVPARLHVTCTEGKARGRRLELLVCDPRPGAGPGAQIRAWVRGARRLAEGDVLTVGELALRHLGRPEDADRDPRARLFEVTGGELLPALEAAGEVPLPPYIERPADEDDRDRYQTVYARAPGSVAAPTAGL
ncbi:MAG: S-adenosylmethionine:tRNA ribosyltransferase-isomerase, partial [Myxococcales bacterium]|nr:S-adenosylmethionine:tRNA ribosyltransferase-isomerase [Myxococcales bacterium]